MGLSQSVIGTTGSQDSVTPKNFNYYKDLIDQNDVESLLESLSESNIDITNENGDTLLIYATDGKHNSIAGELIRLGANVNAKNSIGWTALFYATTDDNYSLVNTLLFKGAKPDIKNILEETPLHIAIKRRQLFGIIEMLIENHDDVDIPDMHGNTPLIWACMNNDVNSCALLLKNGANPNRRNQYGIYPLALTTNEQISKLLISHGAKP